MFSDFSLWSLINSWEENENYTNKLGYNPFKNIGNFNNSMILKFDPFILENCDFDQLKRVGQLCSNNGTA